MSHAGRIVISICAVISALMLLFPPIQGIGGFGDGYSFVFNLEQGYNINLSLLAAQVAIVWFSGIAFYYVPKPKVVNANPLPQDLKAFCNEHGATIGGLTVIVIFILVFHTPDFFKKDKPPSGIDEAARMFSAKYPNPSPQELALAAVIEKDFYGKYPELDQPRLRQVMVTIAKKAAADMHKTAWDAELRDEIAKRAKIYLAVQNSAEPKH